MWAVAEDRHASTLANVTRENELERIDAKRSNYTRRLPLHVGMYVLVTVNRTKQHDDFVNGTLGIITAMDNPESPKIITVQPVGTNGAPIKVRRERCEITVGDHDYTRTQFPLLPA